MDRRVQSPALLRGAPFFNGGREGFTLVELLVAASIVALLSAIALKHMQDSTIRAQTVAVQRHLKQVADGLDLYRADYGVYPEGDSAGIEDPLGILAGTALVGLTTPVPYVTSAAFQDRFGPTAPATPRDPLDPPMPDINPRQYLLYFYYPKMAQLRLEPRLDAEGYAIASIGPDKTDSFVAYYPFPETMPPMARQLGIVEPQDTIYDPSNGLRSGGDLVRFGGEADRRGCCFGGGD